MTQNQRTALFILLSLASVVPAFIWHIAELTLLFILVYPVAYAFLLRRYWQQDKRTHLLAWTLSTVSLLIYIFSGLIMESTDRFLVSTLTYLIGTIAARSWLHLSQRDILIIILGPTFLFLIMPLLGSDVPVYPLSVCSLLGVFLGYHITWQSRRRLIAIAGATAFIVLLSYVVYPNYLAWVSGNQTSLADERVDLPIRSARGEQTRIRNIRGKVVVLDVWYTYCGVCYKGFPKLEQLFQKYVGDTNVYIATLHIPMEEERGVDSMAFGPLQEYSFHKFQAIHAIDTNRWKIHGYPTYLIYDKQGRLRYEGGLVSDKQVFVHNTIDLIEQLRNE